MQEAYGLGGPNEIVRVVRGAQMRSIHGILAEFAAAFQFPWYFGFNRDAFDECISDLGWLGEFTSITVLVFDADLLLSLEPTASKWFLESMEDAYLAWKGRDPSVRFRVVMQTSE